MGCKNEITVLLSITKDEYLSDFDVGLELLELRELYERSGLR